MAKKSTDSTGLHRLEKNNFFYGKLLSVRDMDLEQSYHTTARRILSRFVSDYGSVCGLAVEPEIDEEPEAGDDLVVTVYPGLALDRCGRLVVVEDPVELREELPIEDDEGETDVLGVYVEYDECFTEPVPVAKTEHACEDECVENRIVETAEVTVEPGDPEEYHKSVAEIEFPDSSKLGTWPSEGTNEPVTVIGLEPAREDETIPRGPVRFEGELDPDAPMGAVTVEIQEYETRTTLQELTTESSTGSWNTVVDLSDIEGMPPVGESIVVTARRDEADYFSNILGVLEVPPESDRKDHEVDEEHVLSSMARSYYEKEPREPCCPDRDDGKLLLGLVSTETGDWRDAEFERGPLVYTNDLLHDALARHVTDFENPHEVGLDVQQAMSSGAQAEPMVELGIAAPEGGPTGTIQIDSPDGSVEIRADPDAGTIEITGAGGQYDQYLLVEKSMWNTLNSFVDLIVVVLQVQQSLKGFQEIDEFGGVLSDEADIPFGEIIGLSIAIAGRTYLALQAEVYEDPENYRRYLTETFDPDDVDFGIEYVEEHFGEQLDLLNDLEAGNEEIQAELEEHEDRLEELQAQRDQTEEELESLDERLREMQQERRREENTDLEDEIIDTKSNIKDLDEEISHLENQIDQHETQIAELEDQLEEFDEEEFDERLEDMLDGFVEEVLRSGQSIVELEEEIVDILTGPLAQPLLQKVVDELGDLVDDEDRISSPLSDARDLAVAQDRVAEAIPGVRSVGSVVPALIVGILFVIISSQSGHPAQSDTHEEAQPGQQDVSQESRPTRLNTFQEGQSTRSDDPFGAISGEQISSLGRSLKNADDVKRLADSLDVDLSGVVAVARGPTHREDFPSQDVTGQPITDAALTLDEGGVEYRIETEYVDDTQQIEGRQVGEVVDQYESTADADGPDVVLSVLAAPTVQRIDGVGERHGESLSNVGINTVPELEMADSRTVAAATGVSESVASDWIKTAALYDDAYELTRIIGIGIDEAEAIAEASGITTPDALADRGVDAVIKQAVERAENGEIPIRHAKALESMDSDLVEPNLQTDL